MDEHEFSCTIEESHWLEQGRCSREELHLAEAARDQDADSPASSGPYTRFGSHSFREFIHIPWALPPILLFGAFAFAATFIYYLGFIYVGSFMGIPTRWPLQLARLWVGAVFIVQAGFMQCIVYKFYILQLPEVPSFWAIFFHILRSLAKSAVALLLVPIAIVLVVVATTYCVLFWLLPLAVNLGVPIKSDPPTVSMLCPLVVIPQFISAFVILFWAYWPSPLPKKGGSNDV